MTAISLFGGPSDGKIVVIPQDEDPEFWQDPLENETPARGILRIFARHYEAWYAADHSAGAKHRFNYLFTR